MNENDGKVNDIHIASRILMLATPLPSPMYLIWRSKHSFDGNL